MKVQIIREARTMEAMVQIIQACEVLGLIYTIAREAKLDESSREYTWYDAWVFTIQCEDGGSRNDAS